MKTENYLRKRQTSTIHKFGLYRRSEMMVQQIKSLDVAKQAIIVDVGTADGQVLRTILDHSVIQMGIGIDTRYDRLKIAKERILNLIQATGEILPLLSNSVDIIFSTAVIKHLSNLQCHIDECRRVLKPHGKLIIIDPTPLGIKLGLLFGHFSGSIIYQILSLKEMQALLVSSGFRIIDDRRFMLFPFPIMGYQLLETLLQAAHLDFFFLNQLVCAEYVDN